MVFRQDQAHRGGEEATSAGKRARRLPHPGLGEPPQRLLAVGSGRRHGQALPDPPTGRGWLLHRPPDYFPHAAGTGRTL
ncbi:putative chemoreceptor glutamine deamidase CheD [Frankliniella fusca]|uniref:Chemoreceptor glutamine deamidase CheD n=1 Tax=Frankliniella fusca TaxID=407009 RepID=A0AAE1I5Q1_9NEOP|nr:putative chemoreceptor glutamine deamidase CheD [Frankliniella fusca]